MATSYTAILYLPTTSTYNNCNYGVFNQFSAGGGGPFASYTLAIDSLSVSLEGSYGGSMTYTETVVGSNNKITILFSGFTTDPSLTDDLVSLYISDDANTIFSAAWIPDTLCPTCPPSVNPEDATDCLSCYQQEAEFCDTPIVIDGLDVTTDYVLHIMDNVSGKRYTYNVTTDSNGSADIDTADFPTALFSPYNSPFTITIFDEFGNPVVLTYGYVNYSCIELTISNTSNQ